MVAKPLPLAGAEVVGSTLGQAIVKAATTPIAGRKTTAVWDTKTETWVPDTKESEVNITPVGVLVGGLLALGALAVGQRAIRTGTLTPVRQNEWLIIKNFAELGERGKKVRVWIDEGNSPSPVIIEAGDNYKETGRKRLRARVRARDDVADYNPLLGSSRLL